MLVFVQGKADKPVYLLIHDGKAELKDASALWGKGAIQAREMLTAELGGEISVVAIGQAGENQATMACLIASDDAAGGAGMGAVMGSKNLKAIVVQGPRKRTKPAHPEKLDELTKYFRRIITPSPMATAGGVDLRIAVPQSRKAPCYGCMGDCLRWDYQSKDGQRGKFMCQSATFYQPMAETVYGKDYEVPFRANKLCDEYGLDTMAVTLILIWLIRCLRDGILTDESTGIPISKVGSIEFIETLVRKIALREGFGDVLARGVEAAAASVGPAAVQKLTPVHGQGRTAHGHRCPALSHGVAAAGHGAQAAVGPHPRDHPPRAAVDPVAPRRQGQLHVQRSHPPHRQEVLGQRGCRRPVRHRRHGPGGQDVAGPGVCRGLPGALRLPVAHDGLTVHRGPRGRSHIWRAGWSPP